MTAPVALRQVVAGLCDEVGPRLTSDAARVQVRRVRQRLDEPLRVAIAGRLKAGKSTLVNALIGRRVAPTEVGECTRVVTQFRYGTSDRIDVVRRDGSRLSLPLDEAGMIPQRLGVPAAEVAFVDVALTSANLRDLTVVDTPGLSSTNASVSAGARRFLFQDDTAPIDDALDADSAGAISGAEAIVYVFTQAVRDDDVAALEAFRSVSARLASNPINSVGLFNKADKLVDGAADPWPVAERLAGDQGRTLRRVVSGVVPVVGLLAETTEAGRLTAADCEALRVLAGLSVAERTLLLASVDLFVSRPAPVSGEHRERLLTLLDLYGIGFSLAQLAARPTLGSGDLVRMLYQASGFPRLRHTLDHAFRWRTDAIKAGWALSTLEKTAGHADSIRRPGGAARRDRAGAATPRIPPAAAAGGGAAGQRRRRRAADADGAGADPARPVARSAVDPEPADRRRRRAAQGRPGRGRPLAGVRGRRREPVPVPGRAGRAPRFPPALPAAAARRVAS